MKEGDYVRTKHFGINKIKGFYSDVYYDYIMVNDDLIKKEDIIKSSPNIIDLIEAGDYVNGVIVSQSYIDNIKHIAPEIKENNYGIKSIVTKEQFSCMEYKVGE